MYNSIPTPHSHTQTLCRWKFYIYRGMVEEPKLWKEYKKKK
jgi:hypothetical protein